jgi:hypothetical protein
MLPKRTMSFSLHPKYEGGSIWLGGGKNESQVEVETHQLEIGTVRDPTNCFKDSTHNFT